MRTITDLIATITTIALIALCIDYFRGEVPNFKIGECGQDSIHNKTRKVKVVDSWVYKYCILRDNKCSDKIYTMRIKDFDRIMTPIKCTEAKWAEKL